MSVSECVRRRAQIVLSTMNSGDIGCELLKCFDHPSAAWVGCGAQRGQCPAAGPGTVGGHPGDHGHESRERRIDCPGCAWPDDSPGCAWTSARTASCTSPGNSPRPGPGQVDPPADDAQPETYATWPDGNGGSKQAALDPRGHLPRRYPRSSTFRTPRTSSSPASPVRTTAPPIHSRSCSLAQKAHSSRSGRNTPQPPAPTSRSRPIWPRSPDLLPPQAPPARSVPPYGSSLPPRSRAPFAPRWVDG